MRLRTMPNRNISIVTLDSDSEPEANDSDIIVLDDTKDEVMSDIEILSPNVSHRTGEPASFPFKIDRTPNSMPDFIPINMKQKKKKTKQNSLTLKTLLTIGKLSKNNKVIKKQNKNRKDQNIQPLMRLGVGNPHIQPIMKLGVGNPQNSQPLTKRDVKIINNVNQQIAKAKRKSNNMKNQEPKKNEMHEDVEIIAKINKSTPKIQLSHSNILNMGSIHLADDLRPVIIDGCNVAFGHGNGTFSEEGIIIVIQYFKNRGHNKIVCFLPQRYRHRMNKQSLKELTLKYEKEKIIVYTPSRKLHGGKYITPYDDRFIVQYATECGGVIISNDGYRDLVNEESSWRTTIEKRIINFTFAPGVFMLPKDPLGRDGPTLDEVLKFPE